MTSVGLSDPWLSIARYAKGCCRTSIDGISAAYMAFSIAMADECQESGIALGTQFTVIVFRCNNNDAPDAADLQISAWRESDRVKNTSTAVGLTELQIVV